MPATATKKIAFGERTRIRNVLEEEEVPEQKEEGVWRFPGKEGAVYAKIYEVDGIKTLRVLSAKAFVQSFYLWQKEQKGNRGNGDGEDDEGGRGRDPQLERIPRTRERKSLYTGADGKRRLSIEYQGLVKKAVAEAELGREGCIGIVSGSWKAQEMMQKRIDEETQQKGEYFSTLIRGKEGRGINVSSSEGEIVFSYGGIPFYWVMGSRLAIKPTRREIKKRLEQLDERGIGEALGVVVDRDLFEGRKEMVYGDAIMSLHGLLAAREWVGNMLAGRGYWTSMLHSKGYDEKHKKERFSEMEKVDRLRCPPWAGTISSSKN